MPWVAREKCFGSEQKCLGSHGKTALGLSGNALDRVPVRTSAYQCVPVRTSAYECVPVRTSVYQCVQVRTIAYECVPVCTSAYESGRKCFGSHMENAIDRRSVGIRKCFTKSTPKVISTHMK